MLKLLSTSQVYEEVEQDAGQSADLPPIQGEKIYPTYTKYSQHYTTVEIYLKIVPLTNIGNPLLVLVSQ